MLVLSFWDPQNRRPAVGLFADYPMDFDTLFAGSVLLELSETQVRVAGTEHSIAIKRAAGRQKDLDDVKRLTELIGKKNSP